MGNSKAELVLLCVYRRTTDALNGTDVQGKILLCFPDQSDENNAILPLNIFAEASQFVQNGGGIGLVFAQYTTDILQMTADNCQGIACVLVDLDAATKIGKYIDATRYVRSNDFDQHVRLIDGDMIRFCFVFSQAAHPR